MNRIGRRRPSTWRASAGRLAAVALAIVGLSVVALGPSIAGAATGPTTASEIDAAKSTKELGTILVAGNTVYTLKPSKTKCDAACLKIWPPVVLPDGVMTATAGSGVDDTKLGTVTTGDGALQITYGGKPLYWFSKDKAPGQVKGNITDKWGKWAIVATKKGTGSSGGGSTTGTGGSAF